MINFFKTYCAVFLLLVSTVAFSHSKVTTTFPADGSVLKQSPEKIELTFSHAIRLTKVTLTTDKTMDLDLSQYKHFEKNFAIPVSSQVLGIHTIKWRGLSDDGHVMQGEFSFIVE